MKKRLFLSLLFFFLLINLVSGATQWTCTDSDGSSNIFVKGTVSGTNAVGSPYSNTDFCGYSDKVAEQFCVTDFDGARVPTSEFVSCPSDYTCSDGRCISSSSATCAGEDGTCRNSGLCNSGEIFIGYLDCPGNFFNQNAVCCAVPDIPIVQCPAGTTQPYCSSINPNAIFKCNPITGVTETIDCPSGKACDDGICVEEDEINLCSSCFSWGWDKTTKDESLQCNPSVVFESDNWLGELFGIQIKQDTWCPFYLIGIFSFVAILATIFIILLLIISKVRKKK